MVRTQIYIDAEQERALSARAEVEGTTKSALIREAIDRLIESEAEGDSAVQRFRRAVAESAGIAPYLPEGREYVAELRAADAERDRQIEARRRAPGA